MRPEPVVSVIVPVFNVAPYLDKCLASIAAQTEPRIEAIMVDDGSTDSSRDACTAYVERDGRFRLYSKHNEGQGVARNFGLERARGRYISFVDGDDWIEPDLCSEAVALIEQTNADFLNFGLDFLTPGGIEKKRFNRFRQQSLGGDRLVESALLDDQIYSSPCNKLYRRQMLLDAGLRFPAVRANEDVYFSRALALMSSSTIFTPKVYYHALIREGSTTRKMSSSNFDETCKVIQQERALYEKHGRMRRFETVFKAHEVKLFSYLLTQAAFRIESAAEFAKCVGVAEGLGFSEAARRRDVLLHLPPRNRVMAMACRHPRLLRALARVASSFGMSPY